MATHDTMPAADAALGGQDLPARRARLLRRWAWRAAMIVGWVALVVALGALGALGFQPLGWWWASLVSVAGLVWLVGACESRRWAGLVGWLWGVGHFACGNNWIATAFTYQAKMPAWLGGVAVVALSLYLAAYPALAAAIGWGLRRSAVGRVAGFAGAWILSEWLRSWVFTGFAWNPLGVALLGDFHHAGLAGLAPALGTYGVSGLMAGLGAAMAAGAADLRARRWAPGAALVAGPVALVGAAMQWPTATDAAPGHVPYTLVQPDIPQAMLNDPAWFNWQFARSAALTQDSRPVHRIVLWPESGTPEYLRDRYPAWMYQFTFGGDPWLARLRLARVAGEGALLLTGAVDLEVKDGKALAGRNVITVLDQRGQIVGSYAKAHLVPYGEYLPMRALLQPLGLARLVPGDIDFLPGPGPRTLDLGPLGKAGMQICYEIVFSGQVIDAAHRPDYIFNPSNDGWFGDWGPPQHLAQARLRAIEEGVPVLRSTTNGISAVVDANGLVRQWAGRDVPARLDGLVPPAHAPTLFARMGNGLPVGLAIVLIGVSLLACRRRRG